MLHAVGAEGGLFGIAFPGAVFHLGLVEADQEGGQVFHPESQMGVDIVRLHLSGPLNDVELAVRTGAKPDVPAVFERLGNFRQVHHVAVKSLALFQVEHIERRVVDGHRHLLGGGRMRGQLQANGGE